jgi:hypothetical protein
MATTTPNYGWPVPTSTDLVKDGATAIEALGDAVDATLGGFFNIKQIVQGTSTTITTSSSSTYADTGLTATITPTNVANKVLVLYYHGTIYKTAANTQNQIQVQILRGATTIGVHLGLFTNSSLEIYMPGFSGMIYDAPATTSATTYKTQLNNPNNTASVGINGGNTNARIILIEVEA